MACNGEPITELDVLWINAGLSCEGDTIAMTAATQPSIEDLVRGALPWIPKINFLNLFLACENGQKFLDRFQQAAKGQSTPFILVVERSIPGESNKPEGYWASFGIDPQTASPSLPANGSTSLRPAPGPSSPPEPAPPTAAFTPSRTTPPTAWGLPTYLGWKWKSSAGIPIVCVPGCPVQPDNFIETLLYLLHLAAGRAPMIPLDDALRPTWLFGQTVHEGCDRGGYYEQAEFAEEYGSKTCIVKLM
jgi:hydrogenase small subunit